MSENSKKRKKKLEKCYCFESFLQPGCPVTLSGPFRDNVRVFLDVCGQAVDCNVDGMMIWCTFLYHENRGFVFPLYTIEESVEPPLCHHCRFSGWSHHFVSKRNYHFIIPIDKDWNKPIDVGVIDLQTHLLHGLIHCNGFGHLLCINGIEGGSSLVYGREVMDLWDRICTSLHSREISLVDTSKKREMDLRLLYGVAYGHTWFGRWDYKFCSGSFGVTKDLYDKALEIVSSLKLDTLIRDRHHSCIKKMISEYRDSSDTELVTIRELFRFMLSLKYRIPQKKISINMNFKPKEKSEKCRKFSKLAAKLDSRWQVSRLENVANVVVNALKERKARPVKGISGMSRQEVRESARLHVGDTGLIDYVLKSMNNVIVGEYVVRRAVNSAGMLEYSLTEFDQYEESSDQFDSETSESDVYKHVAYLYQRVLMDSLSKIVKGAVRTILDSKNFTKDWPFKDAADEYLRFISRMVPLRKSSVGELVVVPLHATVLELKIEIEKAMRDTYCIMENLEVREIVELEGVDEDDIIFGMIESGSEIMVCGDGVDLQMASDLNYDDEEDNWVVNCQCGVGDDDGERMVACDLCEVWQHTLCSGIDDDEAVPSLFICYRCAKKCTKRVARMSVKDWMTLPVVTETQMTRWDEILSLPVQNPPTMEFGACDLQWSIIKGHCDNLDRLALIPYPRVDDFIRGEGNNKDCPSRFHIEASRTNEEGSEKAKVDGVLKYILYWCSYGSSRKKKNPAPRPSTKRSVGRPSINKGCTCHFIVKKLLAKPSAALIIYNQDKHVDLEGLPCHGPQDKHSVGTRAMYAPSISEEFRQRVISLLHVGISVETIMHRHNESVEIQAGPSKRYVMTQERKIRRSICELDDDDDVSVDLWVKSNKNIVFFHDEFSDTGPFLLGIQTEWQLQQMICFGNGRLVALDSRFGTNKLKYPVQSLVVFNYDNKAIPVAWIISPSFSKRDTHKWMRVLFNKVCIKDPTWKLAGFIVDDPLTDVLTIREVFQCSVLVCFWRVRHAWHKNIMKRCSDMKRRANLSKALGQIVKDVSKGRGTVESFDSLMEDFVECKDFMDYFKAIWYPRIGSWITALKTMPIASLESSTALEFYHNQLKIRFLNNETDPNIYKRADWLVNKLSTKIHSYFWLDEYEGKDGFSRYWKEEWATDLNAWRKSRIIPNTDIIREGERVKVVDRVDRNLYQEIWNPGSEYAICSCEWGEKGNLCEHVCKVIQYQREKGSVLPSISLLQYNQCLINMLKCPPTNSFIRDDAVSLAVWVNEQLSAQFLLYGFMTTDSLFFC